MLNLEQGGRDTLVPLDLRESIGGGLVVCCMTKEQKQDNKEELRQ